MKIHFIGLSSFLIENHGGFRVLVDPFNDAPEWQLGPNFPKIFEEKPFGANLVLMSEPDADHASAPGTWLPNAPQTKPNSNPFPDLNLRGTVVYEYNGDINIAWHYTIDGIRLAHFADNAHLLTPEQLGEIGKPDIIFISPPKTENREANEVIRKNIAQLEPKVVIWAHHLAPKNLPKTTDPTILRDFFVSYFKNNASSNQGYQNEQSFIALCYVLENAYILSEEYDDTILETSFIEINKTFLQQIKNTPKSFLFLSMLADSKVE